jgi:hypothetical protein
MNVLVMPSVMVVCHNRRIFGINHLQITTFAQLRERISKACGVAALGVGDVVAADFMYNIFPNPTAGQLHLKLSLDTRNTVGYTVYNALGQQVASAAPVTMAAGTQAFELNTQGWANGLYHVNLNVGNSRVTRTVSVQH